jgi:hypothetical protein
VRRDHGPRPDRRDGMSISSLNRSGNAPLRAPRTGPYGRYSRVPLPSWVFEVEALSGPRSDIGGFGSQRDRSARRPASVDFGDPVVNDLKRHSPIFAASVRSPFINAATANDRPAAHPLIAWQLTRRPRHFQRRGVRIEERSKEPSSSRYSNFRITWARSDSEGWRRYGQQVDVEVGAHSEAC